MRHPSPSKIVNIPGVEIAAIIAQLDTLCVVLTAQASVRYCTHISLWCLSVHIEQLQSVGACRSNHSVVELSSRIPYRYVHHIIYILSVELACAGYGIVGLLKSTAVQPEYKRHGTVTARPAAISLCPSATVRLAT